MNHFYKYIISFLIGVIIYYLLFNEKVVEGACTTGPCVWNPDGLYDDTLGPAPNHYGDCRGFADKFRIRFNKNVPTDICNQDTERVCHDTLTASCNGITPHSYESTDGSWMKSNCCVNPPVVTPPPMSSTMTSQMLAAAAAAAPPVSSTMTSQMLAAAAAAAVATAATPTPTTPTPTPTPTTPTPTPQPDGTGCKNYTCMNNPLSNPKTNYVKNINPDQEHTFKTCNNIPNRGKCIPNNSNTGIIQRYNGDVSNTGYYYRYINNVINKDINCDIYKNVFDCLNINNDYKDLNNNDLIPSYLMDDFENNLCTWESYFQDTGSLQCNRGLCCENLMCYNGGISNEDCNEVGETLLPNKKCADKEQCNSKYHCCSTNIDDKINEIFTNIKNN